MENQDQSFIRKQPRPYLRCFFFSGAKIVRVVFVSNITPQGRDFRFQGTKRYLFVSRENFESTKKMAAEEGQVISCHTVEAWNEQLQKGNDSKKLVIRMF